MKNKTIYPIFMTIVLLMILTGIVLFIMKIYKQDIRKGILATVLVLLIPSASNLVMLIATGANLSLQMTVSLALAVPAIISLLQNRTDSENKGKKQMIEKALQSVVLAVFLYGVVMQTEVDQEAMRTGILSVSQMAEEITEDLRSEGLLSADKRLCVAGVPSENELFYFSKACEGANQYAMFGAWGAYSDRQSWGGVFHHLLGLNVEMASNPEYAALREDQELAMMPCFPNAGYIKEIDGIVVVKVSEIY